MPIRKPRLLLPATLAAALLVPGFLSGRSERASAARARPTQATRSALESEPAGWKKIMPGRDLAGWTRLPIPAAETLGKQQWTVEAGILTCAGDGGHDWLRYDRELTDLIFHVEWRFAPQEGKRGYNSGVYVRNSADAAIWHQAQVGVGSGGFLFGNTLAGGQAKRFNLSAQLKERRVLPAGEWNVYELTARGPKLQAWVNGAVVSEFGECEVLKGYVGLEAEGWRIEFRNLKLKEIQ